MRSRSPHRSFAIHKMTLSNADFDQIPQFEMNKFAILIDSNVLFFSALFFCMRTKARATEKRPMNEFCYVVETQENANHLLVVLSQWISCARNVGPQNDEKCINNVEFPKLKRHFFF